MNCKNDKIGFCGILTHPIKMQKLEQQIYTVGLHSIACFYILCHYFAVMLLKTHFNIILSIVKSWLSLSSFHRLMLSTVSDSGT
jgi:hypothetical protein